MNKDSSREYDPVLDALSHDPSQASEPAKAARLRATLSRDVQELWDANFPWPSLEAAAEETARELLALYPEETPNE
jgi:hypothetical protein